MGCSWLRAHASLAAPRINISRMCTAQQLKKHLCNERSRDLTLVDDHPHADHLTSCRHWWMCMVVPLAWAPASCQVGTPSQGLWQQEDDASMACRSCAEAGVHSWSAQVGLLLHSAECRWRASGASAVIPSNQVPFGSSSCRGHLRAACQRAEGCQGRGQRSHRSCCACRCHGCVDHRQVLGLPC
jgi:hypothetical protein